MHTFPVGRDKVNCGNAAREGALGYDLGAPHITVCTRVKRRGEGTPPYDRAYTIKQNADP